MTSPGPAFFKRLVRIAEGTFPRSIAILFPGSHVPLAALRPTLRWQQAGHSAQSNRPRKARLRVPARRPSGSSYQIKFRGSPRPANQKYFRLPEYTRSRLVPFFVDTDDAIAATHRSFEEFRAMSLRGFRLKPPAPVTSCSETTISKALPSTDSGCFAQAAISVL